MYRMWCLVRLVLRVPSLHALAFVQKTFFVTFFRGHEKFLLNSWLDSYCKNIIHEIIIATLHMRRTRVAIICELLC